MDIREFQELSKRTMPDVWDSGSLRNALANYSMGASGEIGEVVDLLKKCLFHGHPMDEDFMEKIIGEIGDVFHYLLGLCHLLNIDPEYVMDNNINKLKKRYPEGFSTERSVNRED